MNNSTKAPLECIQPYIDFDITELTLLGRGADSNAYLVNQRWVFRIPMNTNAQETLAQEVETLPVLAPALPISIPEFKYTGTDPHRPLFSGYRVLPGRPLTTQLFSGLPWGIQNKLLGALYDFIVRLHAIPPASVPLLHEQALVGAYNPSQRHLHEHLKDVLTNDEIRKIENIFTAFGVDQANTRTKPTVIHADLKPAHVLVDDGQIAGIIDWGDSCLGDPDFDFACIHMFFDEDFLRHLLLVGPVADQRRVLSKIPFFLVVRALQDLASRRERLDKKSLTSGLRNLRTRLGMFNGSGFLTDRQGGA